eukprot:Protomagalhaensia_sp_Gyna_25__517@NODE_1243_length_2030_cov_1027_465093_g991_i0_p1_GENE_NODE_1243_length_2030_cov_1027_465093_g991_i0NODE_1243_length_2030_cov_1027_465093_g991_i0_p1_ORF_typecomplete_len335_score41_90LSM14/PF12701_7/7_6e28FDF/PF09532_10/0_74FDF/PF09532_10/1_3e10SMATX/PF14438_6/0_038_NODE_1243_length_2030_cov_1027_465093_g991_i07331737
MSSASSASAIPYIGSKISLVTNSELRYEGTLININTVNSTVTLRDVRMSGTEGRKAAHGYVMPSPEVYDFIIFNGKDIKDLTVSEPAFSVKADPAVVAVNVAPQQSSSMYDHSMHHGGGGHHPHGGHHSQQDGGMYGEHVHPSGGQYGRGGDQFAPRGFSPARGYGPRYGFGRGGGFGGRGRGGSLAAKTVVGELTAQPNSSLKTQVAQAFNFEESNSKFEKDKLAAEGGVVPKTGGAYDKNQSFFDNISCETLNRQHGRDSKVDREKQRELDTETFGPAAALSRGPRYYRRGYRRPGVRGRAADNYYSGLNFNTYRNPPPPAALLQPSYVRAQ